jgi:hypothetical protein
MKDSTQPEKAPLLSFHCSSCGKNHQVKAGLAGKKIKCPQSGKSVLVPGKAAAAPTRLGCFIAAGVGVVLVSALALALGVVFLRIPPEPGDKPDPAYESKLQSAVAKVRALETDTIYARSLAGVSDKDLSILRDLPNLRHLNLDHAAVTDKGMKEIARVPSIVILSLTDTRLTDAGLAELKTLTGLEDLRLDSVGITDAGLAHLQAFPRLRKLSLYQTPVNDAGLTNLRALYFLEWLSLDKTAVTDDGLRHLSELTNLRYLTVWETRVTDAGIAGLKQKLPGLRINK